MSKFKFSKEELISLGLFAVGSYIAIGAVTSDSMRRAVKLIDENGLQIVDENGEPCEVKFVRKSLLNLFKKKN